MLKKHVQNVIFVFVVRIATNPNGQKDQLHSCHANRRTAQKAARGAGSWGGNGAIKKQRAIIFTDGSTYLIESKKVKIL